MFHITLKGTHKNCDKIAFSKKTDNMAAIIFTKKILSTFLPKSCLLCGLQSTESQQLPENREKLAEMLEFPILVFAVCHKCPSCSNFL